MGKVRTHVNIREDQKEWAEENDINLSSRIRSLLDEDMGN